MNMPVGFHFAVEITVNGVLFPDIKFQEVSGLSASISTSEFSEGGENRFKYQIPDRPKYENLVLKRGMLLDSEVIKWCRDAIESYEFQPAIIMIKLLNSNHSSAITWQVVDTYPIKWDITSFNAEKNELVIETIELSYKYFTLLDS